MIISYKCRRCAWRATGARAMIHRRIERAGPDIDPARLYLNEDCGDGNSSVLVITRICRVNIKIINDFRLLRRQDDLEKDGTKNRSAAIFKFIHAASIIR
jgi:hypothetical protein